MSLRQDRERDGDMDSYVVKQIQEMGMVAFRWWAQECPLLCRRTLKVVPENVRKQKSEMQVKPQKLHAIPLTHGSITNNHKPQGKLVGLGVGARNVSRNST